MFYVVDTYTGEIIDQSLSRNEMLKLADKYNQNTIKKKLQGVGIAKVYNPDTDVSNMSGGPIFAKIR